jgi:AcrR family transcriptional regulator
MSTGGDKIARKGRVPSAVMRDRLMDAAGTAFSKASYDAVGVREIAALAGTDPAILIRLFGSKAELFEALVERAFSDEGLFEGPLDSIGLRLTNHLLLAQSGVGVGATRDLQMLLRSAASHKAAPILSAALHNALITPLGERLTGADGPYRAALIIAQVLGFATLRFALDSPAIEHTDRIAAAALLAKLIQSCVDQN